MIENVLRFARETGLDPVKLLGPNRDLSQFGMTIEGEVVEVPAKPIERRQDFSALGFARREADEGEE